MADLKVIPQRHGLSRLFVVKRSVLAILMATALWACGPSPEQKAQIAEQQRLRCLDNFCEGDVEPERDREKETIFKRGGRWFIGPKEYGGYNGSFEFFWPSKTPTHRPNASKDAPEFIPSGPRRNSNGSDVTIELFIENIPLETEAYDVIKKAEREGRVLDRVTLRPELEQVKLQEGGGRQNGIGTYYIALLQKTPSNQPAVVYCDESNQAYGCGTHFIWKHDLRIYVRFNQKHGRDWPEIYQEINRVLNLIREA